MSAFDIPRKRMLERLRDYYKISDERVLFAMEKVPREMFVAEAMKSQAYSDNALPIAGNQTISQPYIVAKMTELLEIDKTSVVLEVGAGSGYQTAILSILAKKIYAVERVPALVEQTRNRLQSLGIRNVILMQGDGTIGLERHAPYNGILVAAGSPDVPTPLVKQLKNGGKLVIPIGEDQKSQRLIRVTKTAENYKTEDFGACAFVPLIGEYGWKAKH